MKKETEQWLDASEYDLRVAKSLFRSGHYRYVIFMSHLSAEKGLKGYIAENIQTFPPYIHNLPKLAELAKLELTETLRVFIYQASDESVLSRYPGSDRVYGKARAREYLQRATELLAWLKQKLKSET